MNAEVTGGRDNELEGESDADKRERKWAWSNVRDLSGGGTWAALETKLGMSVGLSGGALILNRTAEGDAFLQSCMTNVCERSTVLSCLSGEACRSELKGDGERINGTPRLGTFIGTRLDPILAYASFHPADGFLSKHLISFVPGGPSATTCIPTRTVALAFRALRSLVAKACFLSTSIDAFQRMFTSPRALRARHGPYSTFPLRPLLHIQHTQSV